MTFTSKKHKKSLLGLLAAALILLGALAYLGDFPPGDLEGKFRSKNRIRINQPTTTQTPLPEQNRNLDLSPLQGAGAGSNIDWPGGNIDWPGGN